MAKRWDNFEDLSKWLTGMAHGMSDVIGLQVTELFVQQGQQGVRDLCKRLEGQPLYLPMVVTPELAELFDSLATERQRNANPLTTAGYSRDMARKGWIETGESLKFDVRGQMVDGGHRLKAIRQSGHPVRTLVVFGVPAEAALVIDSGRTRTTANTLSFYGVPNYAEVGGLVPRLIAAEQGRWVKPSRYFKPTREEVLAYYQAHPELADIITEAARRTSGTRRVPRATTTAIALAMAVLYRTPAHLHTEVYEFFEGLTTGVGLADGSAVLTLRDTFSAGAPPQWRRGARTADRGGFTIDETIALIFVAWNRRHEATVRTLLRSLTLPLADDTFPVPKNLRMTPKAPVARAATGK